MRKIIALILAIAVASILLVGCGGKSTKNAKTTTDDNLHEKVREIKNAKVGDSVKLENNLDCQIDYGVDYAYSENQEYPMNLTEDEEWIIIAKEEDKALLLLKNPVFSMAYGGYYDGYGTLEARPTDYLGSLVFKSVLSSMGDAGSTWENSVYSWIIETERYYNEYTEGVPRSKEPKGMLKERYFLLTKDEVKKYVSKENRKINKKGFWWLSSTGKRSKKKKTIVAQCVDHNGNFTERKITKKEHSYVRPAIWIALSEDQKTPPARRDY